MNPEHVLKDNLQSGRMLNFLLYTFGVLTLVVPNLFFYCSLILWSIIPLEGFCYNMDFTFNIFLQLFISNVQVVTNMSSGVTSNSKYTTYGSLRIGGQILS